MFSSHTADALTFYDAPLENICASADMRKAFDTQLYAVVNIEFHSIDTDTADQ